MEITQEILDGYVFNELEEEIKNKLDQEIEKDPQMKSETEFHRFVIEGISACGENDFLDTLNDVEERLDQNGFFSDQAEQEVIKGINEVGAIDLMDILNDVESGLEKDSFFKELDQSADAQEETKVVKMFPMKPILSIAASLLILAFAGLWYFNDSPSNEELYQIHYAIAKDEISSDISAELSEIGFSEGNDESLLELQNSMALFNKNEYSAFIASTENLIHLDDLSHYKDQILFYQGLAHMELGQFEKALEHFNYIEGTDRTSWYKALCYLKIEDKEQVLKIIEEDLIKSERYADDAMKIKDSLIK